MPIRDWLLHLIGRAPRQELGSPTHPTRGAMTHVIILDGTMSSLKPGCETNAGLLFKLLRDQIGTDLTVYYEAGLQWRDIRSGVDVMTGRGINRQIRRAYGVLASRYRVGDQIMLVGYSRGAYAARSLGGVIERVGLVRPEFATVRHIRQAYRLYEGQYGDDTRSAFARAHCHDGVQIEAVAVWDTVKALGVRLPVLWRWADTRHGFHNHRLGDHVRNGFHALALDETRVAYRPILWETHAGWQGTLRQVWFRGTHGDIGGQLNGFNHARPLANIPYVWLVTQLERCGLNLPEGWASGAPQDATAPSAGNWRGFGKLFLHRRRRQILFDPSESLHPTALASQEGAGAGDPPRARVS